MTSRRTFLTHTGMGFTGVALSAMLHREAVAKPLHTPKAKSVIWLFMNGGVSHLESFDPKPALEKYAGKTIDESPYKKTVLDSPFYRKNVRDFAGTPRSTVMRTPQYPLRAARTHSVT